MKGMIDIATLRVSPMAMANAKIFIPIPHYSIHHLLIYCNLQYLQDQLKCSQNFRYLEFLVSSDFLKNMYFNNKQSNSILSEPLVLQREWKIIFRKMHLPFNKVHHCRLLQNQTSHPIAT
jgi:hypothetical protein